MPLICGGIVLCGGHSQRMGTSKAMLPFGPEVMLQRVVRLLSEVVSPIVVVAADDQSLPALGDDVIVTRDGDKDRGPLEGLRSGLAALPETVEAAYITSCDVPLLVPEFVRRMIELATEHELTIPESGGHLHMLSAVYWRTLLRQVTALLAEDRRRLIYLCETASTRHVQPSELIDADPQLRSLENVNYPADYQTALAIAGLSP